MAGVPQMQKQFVDYKESLFHEGVLNEQFNVLENLQDQDESNPNFLVEVLSIFFKDSERMFNDLTQNLNQQGVDFRRLGSKIDKLRGSSSSIGAQKVQDFCDVLRNYGEEENIEGCLKALQLVKHECALLKNKLETLFTLQQQILAAGGSVPR